MALPPSVLVALQLIYFFLPCYVANGSPPLLAKLPLLRKWNAPADFGCSWNGKRLLGSHKTLRGILLGTLLGGLVFLFQKYAISGAAPSLLPAPSMTMPLIPYASLPWWFGFLFAFGAIGVGDAGKSLFKRRIGVKPGKPWIPFDQLDYTIGAFLVTGWLFWPGWPAFLFLLILNGLLSAASHLLSWRLHLIREKL